ncbi:hypothetical protein [Membranihabitans maritimus]|uniref:hypothetical protein n=1 Tax=Membranihabitans maritimus TaxID=2904244 RepID=UPI001F28C692|nr:hypothetical protein [Membranihabitans maritimus]
MSNIELFESALQLSYPWKIKEIHFETHCKHLHIHIDIEPIFLICSELILLDKELMTRQPHNFFKYPCFIHWEIPRIITLEGELIKGEHFGVKPQKKLNVS